MEIEFLKLNANEEVVAYFRRNVFALWPRILFSVLWFLLPFLFFVPLLLLGVVGLLLFILLASSGIYVMLRTWLAWRHTMLFLTSERLIDVDRIGFFQREISDLALRDVSNVSINQKGFWKKRWDIGTLTIETITSHEFDLIFSGAHHPKKIRELILETQRLALSHPLPEELPDASFS
ncbi:MAG: PH domain-containing protein [Patescibacteria group bacterium]|jgi:hypothetical protein